MVITMAVSVGRVVRKVAGREAGKPAVIIKFIDKNFALITGAGLSKVKRRRANINHIEPTPVKIDIKPEASDDEVAKAIKANPEAAKIFEV